jgi:GAF domain-containing protein
MDIRFDYDSGFESRGKLMDAAEDRLANAQTLDDIIAIVRATARAVCSADGVTFVLHDCGYCHYVEEDAIAPLWKGQRFPWQSCISGWCMRHAETAVIADVFADPRIPHDVYRRTFVKSLVVTPVGRDAPVAAIGAYWSEKRIIAPREVAMIERLADAVANAMPRAMAA